MSACCRRPKSYFHSYRKNESCSKETLLRIKETHHYSKETLHYSKEITTAQSNPQTASAEKKASSLLPPAISPYLYIMKSIWQQILRYLYIGKKDETAPNNTNVKLMHGMNRISILVFLLALIIFAIKMIFFKRH